MYEWLKELVLRILSVPPEPEPPRGRPESLKVFRASWSYFRYRRYLWGLRQLIIVLASGTVLLPVWLGALQTGEVAAEVVAWGVSLLLLTGLAFELATSYVILKLDYEMRWYMVTDRSLRIREGVWHVREMTMTFANIQNLSISQGPVQRLFGISDLQVQTAGGGGAAASAQAGQHQSMHLGFFRGIDDADSVRDLMLERLRRVKDSGLGDRQPAGARAPARKAVTSLGGRALDALRALRAEATAMRKAAEQLE